MMSHYDIIISADPLGSERVRTLVVYEKGGPCRPEHQSRNFGPGSNEHFDHCTAHAKWTYLAWAVQ